jgi:hypothetical protein
MSCTSIAQETTNRIPLRSIGDRRRGHPLACWSYSAVVANISHVTCDFTCPRTIVPREKVWFSANSIVIYFAFGFGGFGWLKKPGKEISSQPGARASRRPSMILYCSRRPGAYEAEFFSIFALTALWMSSARVESFSSGTKAN